MKIRSQWAMVAEELKKLVEEAVKYIQDALKQKDLRQMAEKGHLAATLAVDALILSKGYEKPKSLYARKRALEKISLDYAKNYAYIVDDLHRDCFYDGICDPEVIKRRMQDVKEFTDVIKKKMLSSER